MSKSIHSAFASRETNYLPDSSLFSHSAAQTADWLGRTLTYPCTLGITFVIQAINRSMEENTHGRLHSIHLERCRRIAWFVSGIFLLLSTLWLGCIGFACIAIASQARGDFFFVQPPHPEHLPDKISKEMQTRGFKLTTLNAAALPDWIGTFNQLRPLEERIDELIESLLHMDDDCICFQELFCDTTIRTIIEKMRAKYPYIVAGAGHQVFGMGSGLAILSKYPIKEPTFWKFKESREMDVYAQKGVMGVKIALSQTEEMTLFTTHLHAGAESGVELRKHALLGIQSLYADYAIPRSPAIRSLAVLTAGDFNIGPLNSGGTPDPEWTDPSNNDFFQKVNYKYNSSAPGYMHRGTTWDVNTPYTLWGPDLLWVRKKNEIDMILALNRPTSNVPPGAVVIDAQLGKSSDHLGLRGTFHF